MSKSYEYRSNFRSEPFRGNSWMNDSGLRPDQRQGRPVLLAPTVAREGNGVVSSAGATRLGNPYSYVQYLFLLVPTPVPFLRLANFPSLDQPGIAQGPLPNSLSYHPSIDCLFFRLQQ